jgi:phosphohistidine phosphatase
MKTLYVLRHGQAAPESEASSDHERPLTERGRAEVRLAAERLAGRPQAPSLILSSSAARASATAELCRRALPAGTGLTIVNELYLAEPPSYLSALTAGGDPHDAVLVVGHNPGLEALVYVLTQQSEHLATASLVEIDLPIALWSDLSGRSFRSESVDAEVGGTRSGTIVNHFRARG